MIKNLFIIIVVFLNLFLTAQDCDSSYTYFSNIPNNVNNYNNEENCFYNYDIDFLYDCINLNNLNYNSPLDMGPQVWIDGRLETWVATYVPSGSNGLTQKLSQLPGSIGNLSEINALYLERHDLIFLPENITELSNLSYFFISDNFLISLPIAFGDLESLVTLDLGFNQLASIPPSIGNLANLEYLFLFNNQLTSLPESICNLDLDWDGVGPGNYPYFACGDNLLCNSSLIPECVENSENFEISMEQAYYSFLLDAPQNCDGYEDNDDSTGYNQEFYGCPNPGACNYDSMVTIDDGSCLYFDCNGDCGGNAILDECGICQGNGSTCDYLGDLNYDEFINIQDLILLVDAILSVSYNNPGDLNNDGILNIQDIVLLLNLILGDNNTIDTDNDGVYDDDDLDPLNPNICSDIDLDSCDDCALGSFDPFNDGYDPDGDGICQESNCFLYITLAENELENIFFNIYNNDSVENCLDDLDQNPNCLADILDIEQALELYNTAYSMCPDDPAANFGSAIVNLLSITTDAELNSLLDRWFSYLNDDDESYLGRISSFNIGIPNRNTSYDDFNTSEIYSMFSSLLVNPTNVLGRSRQEAPLLEELQNMLENVFISRLNIAINRLENVVDKEYNFIISGEMQGDIYQEDIEMDDTEYYLIKAYLHFYNSLFHILSTYSAGSIALDINDFDVLNYESSFLTIREGQENSLPFAYQELENLYESLDKSLNYLINETDWQENDYIQNDLSDNNYLDIEENLSTFEDCLDGECLQSIEGCDNWECSFEYDEHWQDYNCDCVGEKVEMEHAINLSNFMNNPPNNLKDYIPDYTIINDSCNPGLFCDVGESEFVSSLPFYTSNTTIGTFSDFDKYWYDQGDFAYGITLNDYTSLEISLQGTYSNYGFDGYLYIFNADDCSNIYLIASNDDYFGLDSRIQGYFNPGNYYIVVAGYGGGEGNYNLSISENNRTYSQLSWNEDFNKTKIKNEQTSDLFKFNFNNNFILSSLDRSSSSNYFPCPQLSWNANNYEEWIAEWNGDIMTIDINSNNGISSLSFIFDGNPFYWNEYGYYVRKFKSIQINSVYGSTTIERPDEWDNMRTNEYTFSDEKPEWIDKYNLRNPLSWHLVSMGSGDVFYIYASDNNNQIYSILYSDSYWGMESDNIFLDHWIDFTNYGIPLISFNGSAFSETKEPIDITINGLYPYINLEDILLLYKNLFNMDENNWKKTIGGD